MSSFPFKMGQRVTTPLDGDGKVIGGWRDKELGWVIQVWLDERPSPSETKTQNYIADKIEPLEPQSESEENCKKQNNDVNDDDLDLPKTNIESDIPKVEYEDFEW